MNRFPVQVHAHGDLHLSRWIVIPDDEKSRTTP